MLAQQLSMMLIETTLANILEAITAFHPKVVYSTTRLFLNHQGHQQQHKFQHAKFL